MKIIIQGPPIPKMRARFCKRGKVMMSYDPQEQDKRDVKNKILYQLRNALDGSDKKIAMEASNLSSNTLFTVEMCFHLPMPKKEPQSKRNEKLWGFHRCNTKPDLDNLEKFYLDCANGILFHDDRMIVSLHSTKVYSDNPRTEIYIVPQKELSLPDKAKKIITTFEPNQLKEFLFDVKCFNDFSMEEIDKMDHEDKEKWFLATASQLAYFVRKHGETLKKLNKYKDFDNGKSVQIMIQEIEKDIDNILKTSFSVGKTLC